MTQFGKVLTSVVAAPAAISSSQITPMVFCASLPPWPRLYAAAANSCALLNQRPASRGVLFLKIHDTATISNPPIVKPTSGEITMNAMILPNPDHTMGSKPPALAIVAPTSPPTSACEDEDGMP